MEEFATGITFEFPLLIVRSKVKGQVSRGDEGFGAQAAAVRVQANAPVWPSPIVGAAACLAGWTFGRTVCFILLFRSGWSVIRIRVRVRLWETETAPTI